LHDQGRSCWLLVRQASLQILDEGLHFLVSFCGVILQLLVATKQPWVAPVVIASFQAGSTDPEIAEGCILRCILREEHFCIISGCMSGSGVTSYLGSCMMGVAGAMARAALARPQKNFYAFRCSRVQARSNPIVSRQSLYLLDPPYTKFRKTGY